MAGALLEHVPEEDFVKGKVYGLSQPGGQVHRVGQRQPADAFPPVRHQRLSPEDMGGEGVQHGGVLGVLSVCFHLEGLALRRFEAFLAGGAPDTLVHLQAGENQPAVLADYFSLRPGDLQAVGARGVGGGGDENAGRPALKLQIGGHVVLHLDVVPLALVAEGADPDGQAAEPLEQVQLMGALVQQDAAALAGPGGPPSAGVIVALGAVPVRDQPGDALEGPELAAVDHFLELAVNAVGPLVEHHREGQFRMAVGLLVHLPDLEGVDAGRLFDQDVQAVPHGVDGQRGVLIVGHADHDGFADPGGDQFLALLKDGKIRQLFFDPRPAGLPAVGGGGQLDFGAKAG